MFWQNIVMVKLGQIILFTKDQARLSAFLCDLFELEIDNSKQSIRLVNEDLSFLIIEKKDMPSQSNVLIDLFVSGESELEELKDKVEFLNYRHGIQFGNSDGTTVQTKPAVNPIEDIGAMKFFFMTDPDKRRWKISTFIS